MIVLYRLNSTIDICRPIRIVVKNNKCRLLSLFLLLQSGVVVADSQSNSTKKIDRTKPCSELLQDLRESSIQANKNKNDSFDFTEYSLELIAAINAKCADNQKTVAKLYSIVYLEDARNEMELINAIEKLKTEPVFWDHFESITALDKLKQAYERIEMYPKVLELVPQIRKQIEKLDPENDIDHFGVLGGTAIVHYRLKNYDKAIEIYRLNESELNKKGVWYLQASNYNNLALCYGNLKQTDSAQRNYIKAIDLLKRCLMDEKYGKTYIRHFYNVVQVNYALERYPDQQIVNTKELLLKQLKSAISTNEKHIELSSYYHLAKIEYDHDDLESCMHQLDAAQNLLKSYVNKSLQIKINQLQGQCNLRLQNKKQAAYHFNLAQAIQDSIDILRIRNQSLLNINRLEATQQERLLYKNREIIENEKRIKNLYLYGLIGALIALLSIAWLGYKIYTKNKTIESKNNALQISNREKSILLKEIHHRVKNNLHVISSLLNLQARKVKIPAFNEVVKESRKYIDSMSMVHQFLYKNNDGGTVDIKSYLEELGSTILNSWPNHKIELVINSDVSLYIERAVTLGLITSELITNTYKHAYDDKTGRINITVLATDQHMVTYSYNDNGQGLPEHFEGHKTKTLGLKLINMLAEEMHSKAIIGNKNGFELTLNFKRITYE